MVKVFPIRKDYQDVCEWFYMLHRECWLQLMLQHTHTHFFKKEAEKWGGDTESLNKGNEGKNEESVQTDFTDDVTGESNAANERLREGGGGNIRKALRGKMKRKMTEH